MEEERRRFAKISICLHRLLIANDVYTSGETSCLIASRSLQRWSSVFLLLRTLTVPPVAGQRGDLALGSSTSTRAKTAPFQRVFRLRNYHFAIRDDNEAAGNDSLFSTREDGRIIVFNCKLFFGFQTRKPILVEIILRDLLCNINDRKVFVSILKVSRSEEEEIILLIQLNIRQRSNFRPSHF